MRMRALPLLLLCAVPAKAQDYWSYRDWTVQTETLDTGEDIRKTCSASTGGDGLPVLRLSITNGDGGYPGVYMHERAPRGHNTFLQQDDLVQAVFDTGAIFQGYVEWGFVEDVYLLAETQFAYEDLHPMLRQMKAGNTIHFIARSTSIMQASLSGFTAAYIKMMDECGLPSGL